MTMVRRLLVRLANELPVRFIRGHDDSPYLERYYVCGDPTILKLFDDKRLRVWQRLFTRLPLVYLHRFARSDQDGDLHNHPWSGFSLILAGGYSEERRGDVGEVRRIVYRPGSVNRLEANTFHRVDLLEEDCWSVIVTFGKTQTWGFWNRESGIFIPWREKFANEKERIRREREAHLE